MTFELVQCLIGICVNKPEYLYKCSLGQLSNLKTRKLIDIKFTTEVFKIFEHVFIIMEKIPW